MKACESLCHSFLEMNLCRVKSKWNSCSPRIVLRHLYPGQNHPVAVSFDICTANHNAQAANPILSSGIVIVIVDHHEINDQKHMNSEHHQHIQYQEAIHPLILSLRSIVHGCSGCNSRQSRHWLLTCWTPLAPT